MSMSRAGLAFEEAAEDVVVQFAAAVNGSTNVAANSLDIREHGVYLDYTDGGNDYRLFVPWSNVVGLHQYLGV